jgi:hypothetical protein
MRRLYLVTLSRPALPATAVAALAAVLVLLSAPPTTGGELPALVDGLPPCPAGLPEPAGPPAAAPASVPTAGDPTACRAEPSQVEPADTRQLPVPRPGYHHLGATTVDEWSGILGRLTIRDPAVRRNSFDFVATRLMAKRGVGSGHVGWLEIGWAETGWSGRGAQRIYTFDSEARSWQFFDGFRLGDGDQIWVYLHSDADQRTWRAWLWWGERWQLLAAPQLPIGDRARLEQYVEVHVDRAAGGRPVSVPPIQVDNVRVRATPGGPFESWRADRVATLAPPAATDYCLDWQVRYDTWSAGDCPATVQG